MIKNESTGPDDNTVIEGTHRVGGIMALMVLLLTPTVTFGLFPSDASPFYVLFLILYAKYFRIQELVALLAMMTILFIVASITADLLLIKVVGQIVLIYAAIRVIQSLIIAPHNIEYISYLWLAIGVISFFNQDIFSSLQYRVGFSPGRGAPGLFPEPAYFGLSSAFLYGLVRERSRVLACASYRRAMLVFLASVVLSLSAYAIGVALLVILFYQLQAAPSTVVLRAAGVVIIAISICTILVLVAPQLRLSQLAILAIENPMQLLLDKSLSYRLAAYVNACSYFLGLPSAEPGSTTAVTYLLKIGAYIATPMIFAMLWLVGAFRLPLKNPALALIFVNMLIVGPMSIPAMWFWLGSLMPGGRGHNPGKQAQRQNTRAERN
jgi:hypothetical protein